MAITESTTKGYDLTCPRLSSTFDEITNRII